MSTAKRMASGLVSTTQQALFTILAIRITSTRRGHTDYKLALTASSKSTLTEPPNLIVVPSKRGAFGISLGELQAI